MFKKIVVIIFFALLIRVPAYSLEKVGMESLLISNYKIIFSDQTPEGIMSFILEPDISVRGYFLCKIDNRKFTPTNMGCFPFPLWESEFDAFDLDAFE